MISRKRDPPLLIVYNSDVSRESLKKAFEEKKNIRGVEGVTF